jgi:hypothetical protein
VKDENGDMLADSRNNLNRGKHSHRRSILIEFRVPMKLVRLIKICLSETWSKICVRKHLCDSFPIKNGLKQGLGRNVERTKYILQPRHQNAGRYRDMKIPSRSFEKCHGSNIWER